MRKLGKKNIYLFILISILSILIITLFLFGSTYVSKQDKSTFLVDSGSIIYDNDLRGYEAKGTSKLKKSYDGNYYLTINSGSNKYKIGSTAVIYNDSSSNIDLYGTFYRVLENSDVQITNEYTQIDKNKGPYFYKIDDRKYLWIDNIFTSSDKSIKTKNYLIIELDKMGNATFANQEINNKTINPVIIAGSKYSFDIANEKLIIGNEKIDLKNIIGSTNLYEEEKVEEKTENYYDLYIKTLVSRFNNLNNSLEKVNEKKSNSSSVKTELSKWLSLGTIENCVTSVKINYNVFDPNNEYDSIFIIVGDKKIYLNKDSNNYVLRNLSPNTEYNISFGYTLLSDSNDVVSVIDDVVSLKTLKPTYTLTIEKITSNRIYFYLKSDESYLIESGKISLYSDSTKILSKEIDSLNIQNGYVDYFEFATLGYEIELKLEDTIFNGDKVVLNISSKYINK